MKTKIILFILFASFATALWSQSNNDLLSKIDPGRFDATWWNRSPIRLIQTNLPEIEGSMDRDAYVKSIVDASANAVLFNTGGIVANYQTKLPYQWKNPNIGKEDLVADLIKRFHEKGIKYIARFDFSKLDSSIAAKKPEWLFVSPDGEHQVFNGLVSACINGGYYQEYAFEILKEAIANYSIDGVFFNMMGYTGADYSGKNYGICQCENCQKRFLAYSGMKLPLNNNDPNINVYRKFQKETSEELYNRITSFIRQQNPNLIIYNYNAIGTSWIATESGASMSPAVDNIYHATDNVKRSLGSYKNQTPLNLIMGFQAIGYRNIGSSPNLLRTWWLENMLHGAPVSLVVVGTLVHYEDRSFIPVANELFAFHKANEKLFTNVQAVNKVALIAGSGGEYQGMMKLLSEEHIMYDVILASEIGSEKTPRKIQDYDALILDDISNMSDNLVTLLDNYVQNGGRLLVTGGTSTNDDSGKPMNRIRLKSLGVQPEYEVFPQSQSTFLKVSEKDKQALGQNEFKDFSLMMMYSKFLKCKVKESAVGYMRLLPNTRFGPAEKTYYSEKDITDFPGAVSYTFGKGKTVFIPWMIGSEYNIKGNYSQRALFLGSLKNLLNVQSSIVTDASPVIEMTHLANLNGAFEWVGMINHSGFLGNSVREPVTIHNTTIRIKPLKPVREIRLMRSGTALKFKQSAGWIECVVPQISDFEMILCLYK
jgi:hypothetical protein